MKPDRYEAEDKAALYEAMAEKWCEVYGVHRGALTNAVVLDRMVALYEDRTPVGSAIYEEADRAALSLLAGPPDNGDPVTEADRQAMEACPECGGSGEVDVLPYGATEPCGVCGGTGKRGRR